MCDIHHKSFYFILHSSITLHVLVDTRGFADPLFFFSFDENNKTLVVFFNGIVAESPLVRPYRNRKH